MTRQSKQMIICAILFLTGCTSVADSGRTQIIKVQSPNKRIALTARLSASGQAEDLNKIRLEYKVDYDGREVISYSPLGIIRDDQKFTDNLEFIDTVSNPVIDETYTMPHGKHRICRNYYSETTIKLRNNNGAKLEVMGVYDWPEWSKGASAFEWKYDQTETCYFLDGRVIVTPDGGEPVEMGAGDLVIFPAGMSCTWKILEDVVKHYNFS